MSGGKQTCGASSAPKSLWLALTNSSSWINAHSLTHSSTRCSVSRVARAHARNPISSRTAVRFSLWMSSPVEPAAGEKQKQLELTFKHYARRAPRVQHLSESCNVLFFNPPSSKIKNFAFFWPFLSESPSRSVISCPSLHEYGRASSLSLN